MKKTRKNEHSIGGTAAFSQNAKPFSFHFSFFRKKEGKNPGKDAKTFSHFLLLLVFPRLAPACALPPCFLFFFLSFLRPVAPCPRPLRNARQVSFFFQNPSLLFPFISFLRFFLSAPLKINKNSIIGGRSMPPHFSPLSSISAVLLLFAAVFYFSTPFFRLALVFLLFGPKYAGILPLHRTSPCNNINMHFRANLSANFARLAGHIRHYFLKSAQSPIFFHFLSKMFHVKHFFF